MASTVQPARWSTRPSNSTLAATKIVAATMNLPPTKKRPWYPSPKLPLSLELMIQPSPALPKQHPPFPPSILQSIVAPPLQDSLAPPVSPRKGQHVLLDVLQEEM